MLLLGKSVLLGLVWTIFNTIFGLIPVLIVVVVFGKWSQETLISEGAFLPFLLSITGSLFTDEYILQKQTEHPFYKAIVLFCIAVLVGTISLILHIYNLCENGSIPANYYWMNLIVGLVIVSFTVLFKIMAIFRNTKEAGIKPIFKFQDQGFD